MSVGEGSSYHILLQEQGYEILSNRSFGDQEGDYLFLLYHKEQYGFLVIGYGSCSGCDALESCDTQEEVDALMEDVVRSIHWGNVEEILLIIGKCLNGENNNWYNYEATFKTEANELIERILKRKFI